MQCLSAQTSKWKESGHFLASYQTPSDLDSECMECFLWFSTLLSLWFSKNKGHANDLVSVSWSSIVL